MINQDNNSEKIAVLHSIYLPDVRGGAEVAVQSIVDGLKNSGRQVFVIAVGRENKHEIINGVKVYRVKQFNLFNFFDLGQQPLYKRFFWHLLDLFNDVQTWQVYRILRAEQPTLVLTHSLKGLGYEIPRLISLMGLKHVHTIHDMQLIHPSGLYDGGELSRAAKIYVKLCRWSFNSPDLVVFPSVYIKEIYERLGFFKHSRRAVLGNPLTANQFSSTIKKLSEKLTLAYVGQTEEYKGIIDLVKAVDALPGNWQLLIAGDGAALSLAKKISLDNKNVKFLGRLNSAELEQKVWSIADLLINPSRVTESFGLSAAEALAHGVPVLAAKIGALPELVKNSETGWLFNSGDVFDLRRSLEFILANQEQLIKVKSNCRTAVEKYRIDNYLKNLFAELKS